MNHKKILYISLALLFVNSGLLQANSIWAKRSKNAKTLYSDDVARQIGDILTIKVAESSTVDNKAKRDLSKNTDRSTSFNGELGGFADIGEYGMEAGSGNSLSSKADYKDERSFSDSVTVVVVDILPNGNLVVMGNRERDIAGDIQIIEISGIVRPSDIEYDNTVMSEQVADFHLTTKNKGISAPFTKPGWLGAILDLIWPF
ncbi:MAG: flagellar basal body L-ring protein FlgH [Sedimentisphaerales bacterium]|nr:flagellar basal body L-ring protein FlgH [Sedimentisphaerales bacterium]